MLGGTDWEVSRSRRVVGGVVRMSEMSTSEFGVPLR